ncbi:MAG TPA: NADP-dependent oxidoreductase [Actinomycetota bacterium]|nr:NADP-dependent oxidoreductase [Actinomycetota bacterium]
MKAAAITEFGGPENIQLLDLPDPLVGPDIVLVRAAAAGVNPADWKIREGRMTSRYPHVFPLILGWDVSGVVEAVGAAVTAFRPGDRVCAYARKFCIGHGCYAEYVAVVEESVSPAPRSADLVGAAALPLASLTALQTIYALEVISGESVLIHGGSGGVGSFAVQLLVDMGATVLATASPASAGHLESMGAVPIDRTGDIVRQVQAVTPDGVHAVMDVGGGPDAIRTSMPVTRDGGRIASILGPPELNDEDLARGLKGRYVFVRPYGAQLADLVAKVDAGSLRIPVFETFPLEQASEAHRRLEAGGVRGKIALTVGDGQ